jgi:hypothetical protein
MWWLAASIAGCTIAYATVDLFDPKMHSYLLTYLHCTYASPDENL